MTDADLQSTVQSLSDLFAKHVGKHSLRGAIIAGRTDFAAQSQVAVLAGFLAAQNMRAICMPIGAQTPR
ncbi:hypothetical protein [Tateyamaria sp.]